MPQYLSRAAVVDTIFLNCDMENITITLNSVHAHHTNAHVTGKMSYD